MLFQNEIYFEELLSHTETPPLLFASVEIDFFLRRIKLQGVLYRQEGSVLVEGSCHPPVYRSLNRVLEPGLLVGVVAPGVDDIAVGRLFGQIGDIPSLSLSVIRQGERRKDIGGGLRPPEDTLGGIGLASQIVVGGGKGDSVLIIEKLAGKLAAVRPAFVEMVRRPELNGFRTAESRIDGPEKMMEDFPLLPFLRQFHGNAGDGELPHIVDGCLVIAGLQLQFGVSFPVFLDNTALVEGIFVDIGHHPQSPLAGGKVLGGEIG